MKFRNIGAEIAFGCLLKDGKMVFFNPASGGGKEPSKKDTNKKSAVKMTLIVSQDGIPGVGEVTSLPKGIYCGEICEKKYTRNTVVRLHGVSKKEGFIFRGWSGGNCSGVGQCVVTMDTKKMVTATFQASNTIKVELQKLTPPFFLIEPEYIVLNSGLPERRMYDEVPPKDEEVVVVVVVDKGDLYEGLKNTRVYNGGNIPGNVRRHHNQKPPTINLPRFHGGSRPQIGGPH